MSRKRRTVAYFAEMAYLPSPVVLRILAEKANLKLKNDTAVIPKNRILEVQVVLGISTENILKKEHKRENKIKQNAETAIPSSEIGRVKPRKSVLKADKGLKKILPLIGHSRDMEYLNWESVEKIHFVLVDDFRKSRDPISPPGIKSKNLL